MKTVIISKTALDKLFEEIDNLQQQNCKMHKLIQRMLDPEDFGYAVSEEVRDSIRRVIYERNS